MALPSSENKVCCLDWDGLFSSEDRLGLHQFTAWADHSVWSKNNNKKKRFQSADIVALKANMHLIHFDIYKI